MAHPSVPTSTRAFSDSLEPAGVLAAERKTFSRSSDILKVPAAAARAYPGSHSRNLK